MISTCTLSHWDVDRSMRTSGSQLLVFGEFRRSLFDGTAESRLPLLCFLDTGTTVPAFLAEPSMGPKSSVYVYVKKAHGIYRHSTLLYPSHVNSTCRGKITNFQACQLIWCTSPKIILTSPKKVHISYSWISTKIFPWKFSCPSGKWGIEIELSHSTWLEDSLIAMVSRSHHKSISPLLSE